MAGPESHAETPNQGGTPPVSWSEKRMEIITVAILAFAALSTAWSGYQASLWDGIQSSNYTQASGSRTNAAQQRTAANQFRLADLSVFENYIDAVLLERPAVADFYFERFRDEFRVGFDAWMALDPLNNPDAPPSPFAMPEYQLSQDAEADRLEARADELFQAGEDANTISDVYTMTTLLFAAALFFAAMAERFEYFRAQVALLVIAGIGLVIGLAIALGQPITSG
ncbi:MAG TPA: hypothetical protein VE027_05900 [Acidimicrobiia bacterium]|nr:hypothetical protein [Acidimicrobiia bacterium]